MTYLLDIGTHSLINSKNKIDLTQTNIAGSADKNFSSRYYEQQSVNLSGKSPFYTGSETSVYPNLGDSLRNNHYFAVNQLMNYQAKYSKNESLSNNLDQFIAAREEMHKPVVVNIDNLVTDFNYLLANKVDTEHLDNTYNDLLKYQKSLQSYQDYKQTLTDLDYTLELDVDLLNRNLSNLTSINNLLRRTKAAPDLLDRRDFLLRELNQKIGTVVSYKSNDCVEVFLNGKVIVSDNYQAELSLTTSNDGFNQKTIAIDQEKLISSSINKVVLPEF